MSNYIKREDAIRHGKWISTECDGYVIEDVKTADVVQVIRCKDCKYYDTPKNFKKPYCMRGAYVKVNADDYCSKGERR